MRSAPTSMALVALVLVTTVGDGDEVAAISVQIAHPPIQIEGDADFRSPLSGVVRGTGTEADPYVIEGWEIVPTPLLARTAITIRDTSAHVVIRGTSVRGVDASDIHVAINGIALHNASHVTVEHNLLGPGLPVGLSITDASHITLRGNRVESAVSPIIAQRSSGLVVEESDLSCHPLSARLGAISGVELQAARFEANRIECAREPGISVRGAESVTIKRNTILDTTYPILVEQASAVVVSDNLIERGRGEAMRLVVDDFVVQRNIIRDCSAGVFLGVAEFGTGPGLFQDNVIENTSWFPFWTNGYPRPYFPSWENNTANGKPILLYKGLKDVVLDGTGIDAAYVLVADSERVRVSGWNLSAQVRGVLHLVNLRESVIAGNSFVGGGGLRVVYGGDNLIEENVMNDVVGPAMEIGSLRTTLRDNQVQGNNGGIEFRWLAVGSADRESPNGAGSNLRGNVVTTPAFPLLLYETADVHASRNTFDGAPVGVFSAPGTTLRENNLLAGHLIAAQSRWPGAGFQFDARWNWWGSTAGPSEHQTYSGHNVTFEDAPWLEAPMDLSQP